MINLNAIPCKEPYYIRKENKAFRIIPSLGYDFANIINKTAKIILDEIDGRNNIKEILDFMCLKYDNVNKEVIKEDLMETLKCFYGSKIISFKLKEGDELSMDKEMIYINEDLKIEIKHFNELDFTLIMKFLSDKAKYVITSDNIDSDYNEIYVRNALFSYKEEFYGFFEENEVKGLMSFRRYMTKFGNYYRNGILAFDKQLCDFDLKIFFEKTSDDLFANVMYDCKRVRFDFMDLETSPVPIALEKAGFIDIIKNEIYLIGVYSEFIYDSYKPNKFNKEMMVNG